jgi:PAS domain S-box-containing protein
MSLIRLSTARWGDDCNEKQPARQDGAPLRIAWIESSTTLHYDERRLNTDVASTRVISLDQRIAGCRTGIGKTPQLIGGPVMDEDDCTGPTEVGSERPRLEAEPPCGSPDLTLAHEPLAHVTADGLALPSERYTFIRLHATGGIGRIWLARDNHLGRDIALKELRPEQAGNSRLWARFMKEAQITGQLEHPGIVPVYELGSSPGNHQLFYTMRFVRGLTLSEAGCRFHERRIAGRVDALEWVNLLDAFVTVCNTVAYAHSRGVLHRDLKGQNVVLGDFGEVEVLDWGLAKLIDQPEGECHEPSLVLDSTTSAELGQTEQGQMLGTPSYMAPEQASGHLDQIDSRTDVYGLGAILYEILTGRPPFSNPDTSEVLRCVQEEDPAPPSALWPDVPAALEAACLRAIAKLPEDRFASPSELAQEVRQWQDLQRQRAEDALRASEALYHSLVETIPMNVWCKDAMGRFTFGNEGFCRTTKRSLDQIIGRTDFDLFPADLAEKYRRDDAWVMSTGKALETTEEHRNALGETLHVRVAKVPVFDGKGQIAGTQGIFWDVTENKRLKEAVDLATAEIARLKQQLEKHTASGSGAGPVAVLSP